MIVVLLVSLYTSRVVLKALGLEDYGLYNVIGGIVAIFSFLRNSMTQCTQRYLNCEMAKPDGQLNKTFCVSVTIHIFICIFLLFLAETIGLWFLNTKIQIPEGREIAANWVYQSTVFSLMTTILSIPYSAAIISHEKMGYFAVVSVVDVLLKLVIAFVLLTNVYDKLITYGILMMGISLLNFILYMSYCRVKFSETKYRFIVDKDRMKEMLGFTSWTLLGQLTVVGTNQGNGILVNMFHSVVANAAMSIGQQVNYAVTSLTSNFQTAFNPQITKSYASKDYDYLKFLVYCTSKISFLLLFLVAMPIMLNIDLILDIWLSEVPKGANIFCLLTFLNCIINAISMPFNFTIMSTGKIKWYQIALAVIYLFDLPILYILFSMGVPPYYAMVVKVCVTIVVFFLRLYFTNITVDAFCVNDYYKIVLLPIIMDVCVSFAFALFLWQFSDQMNLGIWLTTLYALFSVITSYYLCLSRKERNSLSVIVNKVLRHKN